MKLRHKILLLTVLPVLFLGTVLYLYASSKIREGIYNEAYTGMHATTLAVRNIFETGNTGEYHLDDKGELWKGDTLNISQATNIVDQIKTNTDLDVTVFFGDTRYLTTIVDENGERQVMTQASDKVVETVLKNGKDFKSDNVDILGTKYIVYYIPMYQEGSQTPVGMVFLGTKQAAVLDNIHKMQIDLLTIVLSITVLVSILAFVMVQRIMKALLASMKTVNEIASGNLAVTVDEKSKARKDEIGDMCRGLEEMDQKLIGIMSEIKDNSELLVTASNELHHVAREAKISIQQVDAVVQEMASSSNEQAASTDEAGQSVITMGEMVAEARAEITTLNITTSRMKGTSDEVRTTLIDLNQTMNSVMEAIHSIYNQTNKTNESVAKIGNAAHLITEIASQTNLLALNASIEAARAGEQGKGFAVVANEIKQLATQSDQSANEIQNMLAELTADSGQAVTMMQDVKDALVVQKSNVNQTVEVFHTVRDDIDQSVAGIEKITHTVEELDGIRSKTIHAVEGVTQIAEENAAGTEEAAASVEEVSTLVEGVSDQAKGLERIANRLRTSVEVLRM